MIADSNTEHPSISARIKLLAKQNISGYTRHLVEGVILQGIGETNVAITFVTKSIVVNKTGVNISNTANISENI